MASLVNKILVNISKNIYHQPIRSLKLYRRRFIGMSYKKILASNAMYPSLKERLDELNPKLKDPECYKKVNIGYPFDKSNTKLQSERYERNAQKTPVTKELEILARKHELILNLGEVFSDWNKSVYNRSTYAKRLAEHFKIFDHLFNKYAYFYPVTKMQINFDYLDTKYCSPVYYGNFLKPYEAVAEPNVKFDSNENDLWTLILLNPDGNLYENNAEVLHWFVGNIPGGDVKKGEQIVDYMQPIPPNGTGYHRYVFLLYKQKGIIDYSNYKLSLPCRTLMERTFRNSTFYRNLEKEITPSGLLWFQADYDQSISDFFHQKLNMKEPSYEYEFPVKYTKREKAFPGSKSFNLYLDNQKDPKVIQEEVFKERLKEIDPIMGDIKMVPYPMATFKPINKYTPIWHSVRDKKKLIGAEKYADYYRLDSRPPIKRVKVHKHGKPSWELK